MRNLKKILALVMALVMSMSLVTIANAADFTDDSEISYKEAVDVMTAIGVIDGYDDGSFDPDGILTREEAATLITRMLLGDEADSLSSSSSSFADVDASRWSSPYIEYCVSLGIIAGAGDGNFYPTEQLTGYAFAKMLLIALGYDAEREGYTGTSWTVNVASDATSAGIDQDGLLMSSGLSREGAAQMSVVHRPGWEPPDAGAGVPPLGDPALDCLWAEILFPEAQGIPAGTLLQPLPTLPGCMGQRREGYPIGGVRRRGDAARGKGGAFESDR